MNVPTPQDRGTEGQMSKSGLEVLAMASWRNILSRVVEISKERVMGASETGQMGFDFVRMVSVSVLPDVNQTEVGGLRAVVTVSVALASRGEAVAGATAEHPDTSGPRGSPDCSD